MRFIPNVRFGSFATDAFRASVEQCPLCAESDNPRHESELTRCAICEFYKERFRERHSVARGSKALGFGGHRLHFNHP
jgi:hypothetical protein